MRIVRVVVASTIISFALPLAAQTAAEDRTRLRARSVEWMDAVARKDRAALEKLLAPEFKLVSVGDPGDGVPRSEWVANALRMDWQNRGYNGMRVDLYGDVAVVASDYSFRVDPGEWRPAISAAAPVVDVWVRRNGLWQVQRRHLAGSSVVRWFDRAIGFIGALVLSGVLMLIGRRVARRRRSMTSDAASLLS